MTGPSDTHRLNGLEPDNLMAFLALLGTLRAIECARPDWRARASWSVDSPPLRPVLHTSTAVTQSDICKAVVEGAVKLFAAVDLNSRDDLKLSGQEARAALTQVSDASATNAAARFAADLLIALGSDAGRDKNEPASTSPLCFPSVAQVSFIRSIRDVIAAERPTERNGSTRNIGSSEDAVERSLFAPWQRLDRPSGLRWDHEEGRLHAHQWAAPTAEQPTTEHGAVRLALIGLSCFPVLPSAESGQLRTPVPGGHEDEGAFFVSWPIWRHPMTLTAIRALLATQCSARGIDPDALGIFAAMRASRVGLGKYIVFTRAVEVTAIV
jgi:hypothetical protein